MSRVNNTKMHRLIGEALEKTGLRWHIHSGKKHRKLFIEGRLAMVFSHGAQQNHDFGQIRSIVRRHQCS